MRNRDCVKKCLALILSVSMAVQPGFIALAEETEQETVQSTEAATEAPQAEGSETETPVTEAAQTEAQATDAPETETLVTEAPETETLVTEEAETEAPETEAVQTEAPETETPQTQAAETEEPSVQAETQYTFKYQIYTWNEAQKRNTKLGTKTMTSDGAVATISMPDASSTPDVTVNGKKYVFKGWRVGRIGENNEIQTELQFAAGAAVTADVSELGNKYLMIYAVYEEQSTSYTYTLSYDGNGTGVTSVPSAQTDTNADGSAVFKVTDSKPVRPGYIFQGWAESADAAEVKYAADDEIRVAVSEENQTKTLYAVWKSAMVGPQEDAEINVYVEYMDSSLEKGYRVDEASKKTVMVTCQNKTEHSKYTSHQVKYNDVVKAADVSGFAVEEGWEIVGIARNAGTNQSVFGLDNTFMQGGVQSPYNDFYLVAKKKASSITLNKETLTLEFGAQETLTAEMLNVEETAWTSSNDSVVSVAEDGTITAVGLGTAVITCADKADANIKATCEVMVEDSTVLAAAVTVISGTSVKVTWNEVPSAESYQIYRLEVGNGSYEAAATAEAGETEWIDTSLNTGKKYRYYTEAYATVNGEKKAIKKSAVRTCIIPKITLSKTAMNLQYGKAATLKATKVGVTAVTWTSSDPKIAKVSADGTITATGLGTVTITCTSKSNKKVTATCKVTVRDTTLLQMKATAGKTNNQLSWNKIPSADGYRIYGGECGAAMKLIKTVSADTQSWNHSGLKAGKAYRYCVKAYRIVNGTETVTKTSNTVHSITTSSKFTNAKSVTVSETSVTLQVGESKNLGAKVVAADANRTLLTHTAELVYKSSSSKVATVSKDGTVTAVGKGTCRIYVTAGSGASATVTVTVK